MTVLIRGMHGLGDNFHMRPFVRATAMQEETYLATPWPQVYEDLRESIGLKLLPVETFLRTQRKNVKRPFAWDKLPVYVDARIIDVHYGSQTMMRGSLHDEIERALPLNGKPYISDGPPAPYPDFLRVSDGQPIAIVRPVTVRKEWCSVARNCLPDYISIAADKLRKAGFYVVTVADTEDRKEWIEGNTPLADEAFLKGELVVEQLFQLMAHAAIMVTPVGWTLHAGIAYRTPTICIAGGRGQHCAPWKETDPRQELSQLKWMMPDVYCMCDIPAHDCTKRIAWFEQRFDRLLGTMPVRHAALAVPSGPAIPQNGHAGRSETAATAQGGTTLAQSA